jgi:ATP-dependent Clp protease ATP-binding subunit ClpA
LIQEKIKLPLAEDLLFGDLASGGTVRVSIDNDELDIQVLAAAEA